jgi:hypothetical protein
LQSAILFAIWLTVIIYSNLLDKKCAEAWFATDQAAKVSDLSNGVNSLVTFLLTFFVMATLNRWWSLRDTCLGQLLSASNTLSYLSLTFTGEGALETQHTVLRFCLLSQALLFKEVQHTLLIRSLSLRS